MKFRFYLLSSSMDIASRAYPFITPDGIEFKRMLRQGFSGTEKLLVRIAYSLFSLTDHGVPTFELAFLGHADYEMVHNAFYITNGQYKVMFEDRGEQSELVLNKNGYDKVEAFGHELDRLC